MEHLLDLPHVRQFDFDLYRCRSCAAFAAKAWRAGIGGWESVSTQDAEQMQTLGDTELRVFMKQWAREIS
jgi:hypothetical protein